MRFPGFEGEWEIKKLKDITSWSSGGTPPKDNPLFWNGDIPWISASSMRGLIYSDSDHKITPAGLKKGSKLALKGTLLILVRGSMLFKKIPIGIVSTDVAFNQDVKSIVVNNYSTSEYILNWFLAFEPKILNMVTGTGIGAGKLDLHELKELVIKLPTLLEQRKIASFLSLINKRIETQNKIIKQLESSMFILREKLLTGILRYKDKSGESFPDWEQKRLADIGETYNGLSGKVKEDFGHGKPYIQYKQIFDSPKIEVKNCAFVNVSNEENQNRVKLGDVFFTISSETSREIAISSVLLNDIDEMYLNSFCFGYRPRSFEILNPYFSAHFFRSNVFRNEIVKLAQGSTRFNLAKSELMRVSVSLPSIREQVLIASALDTVEKKITTEKQLLSKYTYQKRYFLINTLV